MPTELKQTESGGKTSTWWSSDYACLFRPPEGSSSTLWAFVW